MFLGSADSSFSFLTPRWILSKSVNVCPWSVSNSASSFLPGCSLTSLNLLWIATHLARSCSNSLINLRYTEPLGVLLSSLHVDSTEFNSDWFRENSSSKACCYGIENICFYGHLLTNKICGLYCCYFVLFCFFLPFLGIKFVCFFCLFDRLLFFFYKNTLISLSSISSCLLNLELMSTSILTTHIRIVSRSFLICCRRCISPSRTWRVLSTRPRTSDKRSW